MIVKLLLILALLPHLIICLLQLVPADHLHTTSRATLAGMTRMYRLLLLKNVLVVFVLLQSALLLSASYVDFVVAEDIKEAATRFVVVGRVSWRRSRWSCCHHHTHLLLNSVLESLGSDWTANRALLGRRSRIQHVVALAQWALLTHTSKISTGVRAGRADSRRSKVHRLVYLCRWSEALALRQG